MKKLFLFLLSATALVSCGSDDSDGGGKLPATATVVDGGSNYNYVFTYDNKDRLTSMSKSGDASGSYQFTYGQNGKVSMLSATSGGTTNTTTFQYDSQNKLSMVTTQGDSPVAITWNGDNSFSYLGTVIKYSDKGDLDQVGVLVLSHATSKKGPFASVKSFDPFALALADFATVLFASKQPISNIVSGGSYPAVNTFDGAYLSNATFDIDGAPTSVTIGYN